MHTVHSSAHDDANTCEVHHKLDSCECSHINDGCTDVSRLVAVKTRTCTYGLRQYDEALRTVEEGIQLSPNVVTCLRHVALYAAERGHSEVCQDRQIQGSMAQERETIDCRRRAEEGQRR